MKRHSIPQSGQSSASGVLGPQREREGEKTERGPRLREHLCGKKQKENKRNNERNSCSIWPRRLGSTTVLSLMQSTDTERQPARINSTWRVCCEGDCERGRERERRTDRRVARGPEKERECRREKRRKEKGGRGGGAVGVSPRQAIQMIKKPSADASHLRASAATL